MAVMLDQPNAVQSFKDSFKGRLLAALPTLDWLGSWTVSSRQFKQRCLVERVPSDGMGWDALFQWISSPAWGGCLFLE
jgi:hypothetical protein